MIPLFDRKKAQEKYSQQFSPEVSDLLDKMEQHYIEGINSIHHNYKKREIDIKLKIQEEALETFRQLMINTMYSTYNLRAIREQLNESNRQTPPPQ